MGGGGGGVGEGGGVGGGGGGGVHQPMICERKSQMGSCGKMANGIRGGGEGGEGGGLVGEKSMPVYRQAPGFLFPLSISKAHRHLHIP